VLGRRDKLIYGRICAFVSVTYQVIVLAKQRDLDTAAGCLGPIMTRAALCVPCRQNTVSGSAGRACWRHTSCEHKVNEYFLFS